jgi:hypothetical protein
MSDPDSFRTKPGSPGSRLLSLPTEVFKTILREADLRSLKCIRLCCSMLRPLTEPDLFHDLVIVPNHSSFKILLNIARHPKLQNFVRRAIYDNRWGYFAHFLS